MLTTVKLRSGKGPLRLLTTVKLVSGKGPLRLLIALDPTLPTLACLDA